MTTLEKYKLIAQLTGYTYSNTAKENGVTFFNGDNDIHGKLTHNDANEYVALNKIDEDMLSKERLLLANEAWKEIMKLYRRNELYKIYISPSKMYDSIEDVKKIIEILIKETNG